MGWDSYLRTKPKAAALPPESAEAYLLQRPDDDRPRDGSAAGSGCTGANTGSDDGGREGPGVGRLLAWIHRRAG
jgi:hypothetical protein